MIEVLITILIMSVGLLGAAAMQAAALKGGNDSILRSKAVASVADISDRIRANIGGLASYQRALSATPVPNPPNCIANQCSAAEMATYDMSQWLAALQDAASGLPGAQAAIVQAVAPPGLLTITVQWTDRLQRGESTATVEQYTTQVQF
ncbi:MAG: type IV pilus modification protein PilV, partial [Gammaproteobacteria bacterium]|nr:type IV pilus modification protein PilV [Gammaproteobacteria bacterium]